jgi:eukaryotic-like serine/threonine-protein kinase
MNQHRSACNPTHIDGFLEDTLAPAQLATLEAHLSVCEQCQSLFDAKLSQFPIASSVVTELKSCDTEHSGLLVPTNSDFKSKNHEAILAMAKRMLPRSDNPAMIGKLGEFEILEPLGAGGMGIVFKGYDHELNRYVAVKVLSPNLSIVGAARQRFIREAQSAAGIVSPYVVPIHAVAVEDEIPYLVMSYIPGLNLQEYMDEHGALSPLEAIRISHQVALGLVAAHERGVVHRDIKPANILLERNVQRAVLTDFGLARAADDATLTHSGLLAGTPNYMSPEQSQGEDIDARSDLFSLGSVMYTMLVGHPPFRGPNAYAIMQRITQESPRAITSVQPSVPPWMDRLVGKLLAKEPSQRIRSSQELADLLAQCQLHLEHPAVHAIPEILQSDTSSWRKGWWATGIAMVLLGAVAVGTYLWNTPPDFNSEPINAGIANTNPIPSDSDMTDNPQQPSMEPVSINMNALWSDESDANRSILELDDAIKRMEMPTLPNWGDE